jgi:phage shock protein PspC (stress-responsive transcriptional regulator)
MTSTDTSHMAPPPATRRLRRSRTDRIGAGVAGGLGEYFGIDPVIFRVLFATAAFFGGAGILAYLLAWAAIPEAGRDHAPIDGWVTSLRHRQVPMWLVAVAAGLLLWLAAFSWWAPGPFFPVMAVVIILVVVFGRRGQRLSPPDPVQATPVADPTQPTQEMPSQTVRLDKDVPAEQPAAGPTWVSDSRRWLAESREARNIRLRRAFPVKVATLAVLAAALLTLGLIDAATGIPVPLYFWFSTGILSLGLIVGSLLRRTPRSVTALLVPSVIGLVALAGSHASLHDGVGQRIWTPTQSIAAHYNLAFGHTELDLRSLDPQSGPRTVRIDQGAGDVHILAPATMDLTVVANVRFGDVAVDGSNDQAHGVGVSRIVEPLTGAKGQPITVIVHLSDGHIDVDRS